MRRILLLLSLSILGLVIQGTGVEVFGQVPQGTLQKGRQKESQKSEQENNLEGTVEVAFKIDGTGKVEIVNINATSQQLADYVIKKLNKIQLEKGDPQIGQIIRYRFVFKKQA